MKEATNVAAYQGKFVQFNANMNVRQ